MQTIQENILNVALLEQRQKHPTIFARFYALKEGESFVIQNDHDPKPLYYQLLSERGNTFTWEYLEKGPAWWTIRIGKKIAGSDEETLGQIAAKDLRKTQVFIKHGLDFCCGGNKTVRQACFEKGLDITAIENELQQVDKNFSTRALPFNDWSLDFLADYIVNTHHSYIKKSLPDLKVYAAKVAKAHGNKHPELLKINELVEDMSAELSAHMLKEERVLFPYIKTLVNAENNAQPFHAAHFGTVQNPVGMMEMEHEMTGKKLEEIRALSNNYTLPEHACASYSFLYRLLNEFEDDLHIHIHLENNILFPKAIELEKKLNATNVCSLSH
ncbi:MAG TPA: iron-sulfur cluster repair di-iron protein [Parafilimonas sp.]|nr:iron-sulfur cluster repair di-iron protein [Parafilimonas sp.]